DLCVQNELKLDVGTIRGLLRCHLESDLEVSLSVKQLSLLRSTLLHEAEKFHVYDYRLALSRLVARKEQGKALKQLLLAIRQLPQPASDDSLDFRPANPFID